VRYRIAVWVTGVACFAGLGGWSAGMLATAAAVPSAVVGGGLLGGLLGAVLVIAFLHALEPAEPVRARTSSPLR